MKKKKYFVSGLFTMVHKLGRIRTRNSSPTYVSSSSALYCRISPRFATLTPVSLFSLKSRVTLQTSIPICKIWNAELYSI